MNKIMSLFTMLALSCFLFSACNDTEDTDNGDGPHCEDPPPTCDPVCDATAMEVCCGTTCEEMQTCDPECATDGTEFCNPCTGSCEAMPATCDPVCDTATEYCDDGTCVELPVCDPECEAPQICVE